MEVIHADEPSRFTCQGCEEFTKKARRCAEDRWDFKVEDGPSVFPIVPRKGGVQFGFCPAKATWYPEVSSLFRMLVLCAETGKMPYDGGICEQPADVIELLGWFVPKYKASQWQARMKQIFGDGKSKTTGGPSGSTNRRPSHPSISGRFRRS